MKYFLSLFLLFLALPHLFAVEMAGIHIDDFFEVDGTALKLNGCGIRKKFIVKVYVGALYTERRVATTRAVIEDVKYKAISMYFLYKKVATHKITNAFADGFNKNSPDFSQSSEAKAFLALFNKDFVRGDRVDLVSAPDKGLSVYHNDRLLGTIASEKLVRAVFLVYLGDKPASKGMKQGMLGQ